MDSNVYTAEDSANIDSPVPVDPKNTDKYNLYVNRRIVNRGVFEKIIKPIEASTPSSSSNFTGNRIIVTENMKLTVIFHNNNSISCEIRT